MTDKLLKAKYYLNNVFALLLFFITVYLMCFSILIDTESLANSLITNEKVFTYLNIVLLFLILILSLIYIVLNKTKFKWQVPILICIIAIAYCVYYYVLGKNVNNVSNNYIFSNIKYILVFLSLAFLSTTILPKVLSVKIIKRYLSFIALFTFASIVFFFYYDFPMLISNFPNSYVASEAKSFFVNKNTFGLMLMVSSIGETILYELTHNKRHIAFTIFFAFISILSICRTAITCELIFFLIYLLIIKKYNKKLRSITLGILICILVLFLLLITGLFDFINFMKSIRLFVVNNFILDFILSFDWRIDVLTKAFRIVDFKTIWFGLGSASSELLLSNMYEGYFFHNAYLEYLLAGGIFLTLINLFLAYKNFKTANKVKKCNRILGLLVIDIIVCYIIYSMNESILLFDFSAASFITTLLVYILPFSLLQSPYVLNKEQSKYKKVAFITTIFPSKEKKWYGIYLYHLAKGLINLGHEVEIILVTDNKDLKEYDYEGISVLPLYHKKSFLNKIMIINDALFKCKFERMVQEGNYDDAIIHFYEPETQNYIIDCLKENKVRVIHYLHSRNIFKRVEEAKPIYRKIYLNSFYKQAYKKCDEIVCVSHCVYNDLKEKLPVINASIIYNGVDKSLLNKDVEKNFKVRKMELLTVGNLLSIKGHKYVLKALKLAKDKNPKFKFHYEIIGDGPEYNNLVRLVSELNLEKNVAITHSISQNMALKRMQNAHVFVMPSYYEALGCVYLEAMAMRDYVIGCKHQGIAEIINDLNGFLVEEKNENELCDVILDIYENLNNYTYKLDNSRMLLKHLTWNISAKELEKLL